MSTSVIGDSIVITSGLEGPGSANPSSQIELEFAKCDCCGLTEECTLSYIENIRERYGGKWICGLCAEAVKDEILRGQKLISPDEAIARHFTFCNKFRATGPPEEEDPTVRLIRAMRQIFRRILDSPKSMRSMPSCPTRNGSELYESTILTRSGCCMPSLARVDASVYCGVEEGCD